MNPDPETRFPYRMSGTIDSDAADGGRAAYSWQTGEGDPRIHHGVTESGATFQWVCDEMQAELPLAFFVPGLERVYVMRTHEVLTGLSGHLEGWGVEITGAGTVWPSWQTTAFGTVPAYPWWAELDMAGAWVRK